jgi:hypothetical protein
MIFSLLTIRAPIGIARRLTVGFGSDLARAGNRYDILKQYLKDGGTMGEILSFEEIQRRYDGEWALIAYTELDENLRPIAGEVMAHSPERDLVYEALSGRDGRGVAIECFVKAAADMAFIL